MAEIVTDLFYEKMGESGPRLNADGESNPPADPRNNPSETISLKLRQITADKMIRLIIPEEEYMDIPALSSSMAANSLATQSSILVAKKSLDIQKQVGQDVIALIQTVAPRLGDGNGKLVNLYG